jgi:hypothetical protein
MAKGNLCAQDQAFSLHAATKVAANDKQGRLTLCKYILRPPLANDRLKILDDRTVRLDSPRARHRLFATPITRSKPLRTGPPGPR